MNSHALPADAGVLLIGHGGVDRIEDVRQFITNIRHGRPAPDAVVDEVARRWTRIGGSPLNAITRAQAEALEARLGVPVGVASRMWTPTAREAVERLVAKGVERLVSLPLAPFSVAIYNAHVAQQSAPWPVTVLGAAPWGTEPALVESFADAIREQARELPEARRARAELVLTAHSLPTRVIAAGDTYATEVRACASAVIAAIGWDSSRARVAFQSQGMDGGDWLGPDLPTTFAALEREGVRDVVMCAVGFLADHTEVLFDLDIEARAIAERHGLSMLRAASLNARPRFIDALESVARATIET